MLLDGHQRPDGEPDGPLAVDVEILDGLPAGALQAVQPALHAGDLCTRVKVSQKLRGNCHNIRRKNVFTILEKFDSVSIFIVVLLKLFLLCFQLFQILCVLFFKHVGGRITAIVFLHCMIVCQQIQMLNEKISTYNG